MSFSNIAQTIDSRSGVGALWFALVGAASCLFVFLAYRAGGVVWDSAFGKYGEFCEMATGLAIVFVVYLSRYFFFPSRLQAKTRQSEALKAFFTFFVILIVTILTFIYPRVDENYIGVAYGWYGLYLLAIVGVMLSYGCEICWSLLRYHGRLISEIRHKWIAGTEMERLLLQCSKLRREINSDCIKTMYGVITVAVFVLFVSWDTYFRYAKSLHILFLCVLVVTCVYPSLRMIWTINPIKNREIEALEERIENLDMEILAEQKRGKSVNELEEQRNSLERSKKRLEKKGSFTKAESHINVVVSVF